MTGDGRRTASPSPADLGVAVGDVFVLSWGYDQTNVDFWEVVRLTGAGVEVRHLETVVVEEGNGTDLVEPGFPFGTGKVVRLREDAGTAYIAIRGDWARKWDGRPVRQTSWGMGH